MKKHFSGIILFILFSTNTFAQVITYGRECDFFGPLKFKNGMATVIIKATYRDLFKSPEDLTVKQLEKQKKIRYKDYFPDCCDGSSIGFVPENCSFEYGATMRGKIKFDINHCKQGQTLYLTCIVFSGVKHGKDMPFFVISDISLKDVRKPKSHFN
jgi:hypothetical protein